MPSVTILTFHRIIPKNEKPYFIPPMAMCEGTFIRLIERLSLIGKIIPLKDAVTQLKTSKLSSNVFSITFDDGYIDNYTIARRTLASKGIPATFFIPFNQIERNDVFWWDYLFAVIKKNRSFDQWLSEKKNGKIDAKNLVNIHRDRLGMSIRGLVRALNSASNDDRNRFLETVKSEFGGYSGQRLLMNWNEIKQMANSGFEIGSHTMSHIPLTDISETKAVKEITVSKHMIGKKIGKEISGFCYPRGAYSKQLALLVQQGGYDYAVSTQFGSNTPITSPYALKRRNMSDYPDLRRFFPVSMHLLELSGWLDSILTKRRIA